MSKNGEDRGMKGFAYKDLTDDSEAEGSDGDGVALVMTDSDNGRGGGVSRKYVVSEDNDRNFSSICKPQKFTRNERICVIVGGLILLAAVILLIVVILVTQLPSGSGGSGQGGSGSGGDGQIASMPMPWDNVRLPANVTPSHYLVNLNVNLQTFQVTGSVNVTCSVNSETKYILIHAKDMSIGGREVLTLTDGGSTRVQSTGTFQPKHDFYVLELDSSLQPGTIFVNLDFNYTLRDDLAGFYKSSYVNELGERRFLATTQFEPTDARRAFPCFDEPSLKANFSMRITHNSNYHAVSNMPVENTIQNADDETVTSIFETSVQMSTYLVAFIVSDFECMNDSIVEGHEDRPLKIQVCSSPVVSSKTGYALRKAKDIIMFYEKEFAVPYPLPKQDLFAIPDFAAGAMENWGLITYRETALLYDEETDPATSKQRVAVVIAHELAHQWFGNLVTMAWWDGLWLNEGFASFMEYIGTNSSEPGFNMLDQFFGSDLSGALDLDSLNESHPILQEVASPDEINSLFDTISYSKGASVIRMLKHYLTEDNFKAGITFYLNMHKFGNAETSELWEALQSRAPAGKPTTVSALMDTWTKQEGYPVVDMTFSGSGSGSKLTLSQRRFLAVPPEGYNPYSDDMFLWKIPFDYITCDQTHTQPTPVMMETNTQSVSASLHPGPGCWVKANVNQSGFYRVNYDIDNWYLLISHLKGDLQSTVLSPVDRAGLLDDAFAFARAGLLKTSTALNMTQYLSSETAFPPWEVAIKWFYTLGDLLSLTSLYGKYRTFVSNILEPMVDRVMSFDERDISHFDVYLRSTVLRAAWRFGNEKVTANVTEMFRQWMKYNTPIDPNLKTVVYGVGVAEGGEEAWNFVWNKYNTTDDPYEKRLLLRSLAESTEPWILARYLNYSITKIRSQDTLSVVIYISRNIHGRYLAWNFIRNNWPYLRKQYGGGSFFDRFIRYITESFSTPFELEELVDFFARYPDAGSATRGYRQAIEAIKGNIQWLANSQDLQTCLDNTAACFNL